MHAGEVREVTTDACADVYLIETGMYGVAEYGGAYLLDADRPAIVETGIGTHHEAILEGIREAGVDPDAIEVIAVTHVHLDHAGGAGFLAEACPHATVYAHESGAPHLIDTEALVAGTKEAVGDQWAHYVEPRPLPEDRVESIADGDEIDLGDRTLIARHAPGHAPHQVVFHVPEIEAVFTGDAAGIWIPARETVRETTPPPQFDLDQAVADLDTIREIAPTTLLYTHFGPAPYSDELMTEYEHTLAAWIAEVDAVAAEHEDEEAVIQHFVDRTDLDTVWNEEKAAGETRLNVVGALRYLERIQD